jgi:hypothetical protein
MQRKGINGIWTQLAGLQYRERLRQRRPSRLVDIQTRNEAVPESWGRKVPEPWGWKMEVGRISGRGEL